jgi:hypothetical protein
MQNIQRIRNVPQTDVAISVRLIVEAWSREMYRLAYAIHLTIFCSNSRDKQYPKLLRKVINAISKDSEKN